MNTDTSNIKATRIVSGVSCGKTQELIGRACSLLSNGEKAEDVLVLCAANLGIRQQIFVNPISDFSDVVMMNVVFNYAMAQAAAAQMREKGKGSIVFVNSNTAYRAIPDRIAYSASKGGVLSLSRALALDLGKYHIRSVHAHAGQSLRSVSSLVFLLFPV